jgi:hypothetical protein
MPPWSTTTPIHLAHHNISPSLEKQLVLELEVRKASLEVVDVLPRRVGVCHAGPLDEHVPHPSAKLGTHCTCWLVQQAPIVKRRQDRWCKRRLSPEWLENTHMEHIMYVGTLRKAKPVGDWTNMLSDLERPGVTRAEFAMKARQQGLRRTM